jgi:hypothetical protein
MKLTLTLASILLLVVGCGSRTGTPQVKSQPIVEIQTEVLPTPKLPVPPKKDLKLKEIKDSNYSDKYMYPEDTKAAKKDPVVVTKTVPSTHSSAMTKEECISMISQEKFDKYTTMFGSQSASLKRCTMIKAMNK